MTSGIAPHLSVLLPPARVAMHVIDRDLIAAATQLKSDWRFARIGFEAQEGDVRSAINFYTDKPSPDLLLIETKTIDAEFIAALETLASTCSENTAAIVIGPVNDVYLYRKLIDMGVSDYLVGPLRKDTLSDVIAKTLMTRVGHISSRLIAFVGAKGGIGTSTLAQYAALIASDTLEHKTLLLDMAGAWSYMPIAMGGEPQTSLSEICRLVTSTDQDAFKRLIYKINDKLSILPTGMEKLLDESVAPELFETLLNHLMVVYPVVVLDVSGAPNYLKKLALNRAHEIVIISNPTISSLRTARALMQEVKDLHDNQDHNIDLIVNMTEMAKDVEVSKTDIEKAIDKKPFGYIQFAPKTFMNAEISGKRDLKEPALQDAITLLTKILTSTLGGGHDQAHKISTGTQNMFSNFLSSLKIKNRAGI